MEDLGIKKNENSHEPQFIDTHFYYKISINTLIKY